MDKIEVKILNSWAVTEAEQNMIATARLTQRGEKISSMSDLEALFSKKYEQDLVRSMASLPHPTIQKFGIINIGVVGASRRFLAQITRHQNEVKFMSGSLQYSDYSDKAQFCVPYEITVDTKTNGPHGASPQSTSEDQYLSSCLDTLNTYQHLVKLVGRDAAGYVMPQGMRNVLIMSATPYQWKHMINQRVCRRNTLETRYVMLLCWEQLIKLSPMFENCGPACMQEENCYTCHEGKMSCGHAMHGTPKEIVDKDFPLIRF